MALPCIAPVLQTRKVVQWQPDPVTASAWPPGTICRTPSSAATCAMAIACEEFTLPIRKSTLSLWISLRAFCTATSVLSEVEILDHQLDCRPRMPPLALAWSRSPVAMPMPLVLSERRIDAGQRIIHSDLDRFLAPRLDDERAGDLHRAGRKANLEDGPAADLVGELEKAAS